MIHPVTMLKHPLFRCAIAVSSSFGVLVGGMVLPTLAQYTPTGNNDRLDRVRSTIGGTRAYNPPADSRSAGNEHTGGGVRGCGDEMVALAPRLNFVGQTQSQRPTFVWYVFSSQAGPLEFHLYEYQEDGSLDAVLVEPIGPSSQGYMAYTLPATAPALSVGDTYLWQVVMYCDQALEEVGRWTSADIEVVEPPTTLPTPFPEEPVEQAQAYAEAGIWYEAMALVYDATTPEAEVLRQELLLDLADFEEQPEDIFIIDLSSQLREIADMP
jgi:hypothetical protein